MRNWIAVNAVQNSNISKNSKNKAKYETKKNVNFTVKKFA